MKKLMTMMMVLLASASFGQVALGDVIGTIVKQSNNEPIWDARVFIKDQDKVYNSKSQMDGRFRISAVPPGTYQVLVLFEGDTVKGSIVNVSMDGIADAGTIKWYSGVQVEQTIVITHDTRAKLDKGFLPIPKISYKDIAKSSVKFDLKSMAASMTSDVKLTDDGSLVFRGARKGDMIYYVDGMKVVGELSLPSTSIYQMMVYSGGLPAQFGDTMGGVVAIESKGYFQLLRDYNSQMLKMGM